MLFNEKEMSHVKQSHSTIDNDLCPQYTGNKYKFGEKKKELMKS